MSAAHRYAIRLPAGVRDFLPRAAARRRAIVDRLLAEFEAWGFERIITPMFECADVLERGLGEDARAAALRFVEPTSGEIVALRPDITPQVARMVATRLGDVGGPIRLCYEGAVTRLEVGPRGQREILQTGVELYGASAPEGDAEAIAVAAAALASTRIPEVRLDVGHVALARFALGALPDEERRARLKELLAKKDRAGVARAAADLPADLRTVVEALPTLYGPPERILAEARALPIPDAVRRALDTVEAVLALSKEVALAELHSAITVDLGEVRGFEYYTGIRFDGYAAGAGDAVLRGGRYDELAGRYGRSARAVGFAVDVEAVAQAQRACGIDPPDPPGGVLVVAGPARRRDGVRIAAALRVRGVRAAIHLGSRAAAAELAGYAFGAGFSRLLLLEEEHGGAQVVATGAGDSVQEDAAARAVPAEAVAAALAAAAPDGGDPLSALAAALELATPAAASAARRD